MFLVAVVSHRPFASLACLKVLQTCRLRASDKTSNGARYRDLLVAARRTNRIVALLLLIFIIAFLFDSQSVLARANNAVPEHPDQQALPIENSTPLPCVHPAPLFSAADYEGPLKKLVVYFSRKPEITTVHLPRRRGGLTLCALDISEKFRVFTQNSIEPVTFVAAAFNSGLAQAQDDDPSFGQGTVGYAKRYGAALGDEVSSNFFHTFLFPVVFRQDPRYYRRLEGSGMRRLGHALSHVFVAEGNSGKRMVNFSEWLGTSSSVALSNTYHPGNSRGLQPAARRVGLSIASDMGFDVLREFWPEIVHKLKLPFRERDHQLDQIGTAPGRRR